MENIKKLRKEHGFSQQELAERFHVSQQSIHKYENDLATSDFRLLIDMAEYFNTSVDYLIGATDIRCRIIEREECMLDEEERLLIRNFRALTDYQRKIVSMVVDGYNSMKDD